MKDSVGLRVLLAASIRWPVAAKLAIAFLRHGCEVQAVCPPDHPFAFIDRIRRLHPYRGADSIRSLYESITSAHPDIVVPCDDGVVWQLHELHRTRPELRPVIERSIGPPASYPVVAQRAELMRIAAELEVRVPQTTAIKSAADLHAWFAGPDKAGVLKLDWTCGGRGVRVVHSEAEAQQALASMLRPATLTTALGRWMLIHDALAIWKWRQHKRPAVVMQQFVRGQPANTMLACRDGEVLAMVTVEVLYAQDATGTALAARVIENSQIRAAAQRIAGHLRLSGFHGLDFMLEQETGHAYLIELNPRCTQLGHLRVGRQGDLAAVLSDAYTGTPHIVTDATVAEDTVAFFPEVLMSNPRYPQLARAYVDVPWEEPLLTKELFRRDWRDRGFLARMYRRFERPGSAAVSFGSVAPAAVREPAIGPELP